MTSVDTNFYKLFDCNYYVEDKFNDLSVVSHADKYPLSVLHLNTRSLNHNFSKVNYLLLSLKLHVFNYRYK